MDCVMCKKRFEEKDIEVSHDIPKYLGGTDLDGRHNLCKNCHDKYELIILSRCYIICLNKLLPKFNNRKERIPYINSLKFYPPLLKAKFFDMAQKVKKEVYEDGGNK